MEGINILEWNEDGEEISFILRLFGDRVIMPGGWESQLGKVTVKKGDFDFEVPGRE
jgi:hypothetical protein